MNLKLDQNQRLQLVAILDNVEAVGRREGYAVCKLQEKIDLDDDERREIDWRKLKNAEGREFAAWSNNGKIHALDYDLADEDVRRISTALDKFPVVLSRDRHWWEPLVAQLPDVQIPDKE